MRKLLSTLLFAPLLTIAQDWAPVALNDARVRTLRDGLAAMTSIQGNMTQTKTFSFMDKPLVSNGAFRYAQGDKLRWEFIKPTPYCILINGANVRLQENKQEKDLRSVDRVMRQVKEVIIGCINGSIITDPAYQAEAATKGSDLRIAMRPKDRKLRELIAGIEVTFGPTAKDLRSVKLIDPSGDATFIQFDGLRVNEAIAEKVFAEF